MSLCFSQADNTGLTLNLNIFKPVERGKNGKSGDGEDLHTSRFEVEVNVGHVPVSGTTERNTK